MAQTVEAPEVKTPASVSASVSTAVAAEAAPAVPAAPTPTPETPEAPASDDSQFDPQAGGEFPPDLYNYVGIATGLQGLEVVTDRDVDGYYDRGYLVVEGVLNGAEVESALEGLSDLIDGKRPDFRGIQFEAKARSFIHTLPREEKPDYVRKLIGYVGFDDRLKALSEHPALIAFVTKLLGEAPALYADQALLKPPMIGREKPWHQDHAYFNVPIGTRVVGVWIALDEATPENGCMHVIPFSHQKGPVVHFRRRDWQICDTDVDRHRIVAAPLKPGGALFFDGLMHHGTPPSESPKRRRALQFHYVPASALRISQQERLAVFGSEGKDVQC